MQLLQAQLEEHKELAQAEQQEANKEKESLLAQAQLLKPVAIQVAQDAMDAEETIAHLEQTMEELFVQEMISEQQIQELTLQLESAETKSQNTLSPKPSSQLSEEHVAKSSWISLCEECGRALQRLLSLVISKVESELNGPLEIEQWTEFTHQVEAMVEHSNVFLSGAGQHPPVETPIQDVLDVVGRLLTTEDLIATALHHNSELKIKLLTEMISTLQADGESRDRALALAEGRVTNLEEQLASSVQDLVETIEEYETAMSALKLVTEQLATSTLDQLDKDATGPDTATADAMTALRAELEAAEFCLTNLSADFESEAAQLAKSQQRVSQLEAELEACRQLSSEDTQHVQQAVSKPLTERAREQERRQKIIFEAIDRGDLDVVATLGRRRSVSAPRSSRRNMEPSVQPALAMPAESVVPLTAVPEQAMRAVSEAKERLENAVLAAPAGPRQAETAAVRVALAELRSIESIWEQEIGRMVEDDFSARHKAAKAEAATLEVERQAAEWEAKRAAAGAESGRVARKAAEADAEATNARQMQRVGQAISEEEKMLAMSAMSTSKATAQRIVEQLAKEEEAALQRASQAEAQVLLVEQQSLNTMESSLLRLQQGLQEARASYQSAADEEVISIQANEPGEVLAPKHARRWLQQATFIRLI